MKKVLLTIVFGVMFGLAFASNAVASRSVTCAAICRYTCEFSVHGSCSDSTLNQKIRRCCTEAFANTPGINDVQCVVTGSEN